MSFETEVGYDLHKEVALDQSEDEYNLHRDIPLALVAENSLHEATESERVGGQHRIRKFNCTLCGLAVTTHLLRHTLHHHLPWYFSPDSACWNCKEFVGTGKESLSRHVESSHKSHWKFSNSDVYLLLWCQLMFGILVFFASELNLSSVVDLLQIVLAHKLFPEFHGDVKSFDESQIGSLRKVCEVYGLSAPETFAVSPPNNVVCILHWKIVVKLLDWIRTRTGYDVCQFRSFFSPFSLPVPSYSLGKSLSADTHCHLDKIVQMIGVDNLHILRSNLSSLQFCISNFVFPSRWNLIECLYDEPLVHCTIGVHPHAVIPGEERKQVLEVACHLQDRRFIGVGEVGLDFQSGPCKCRHKCKNASTCFELKKRAQLLFLREVLPLADRHNLTLVLHCRDDGDGAAAREALHLLKETGLTHLRIHRHCFIGTVEEMADWLKTLPNVKFGITYKSLVDPQTLAALSTLNLRKIVLETDSPYLKKLDLGADSLSLETCDFSPCDVYIVAYLLSCVKHVTLPVLTEQCHNNALQLYGLSN